MSCSLFCFKNIHVQGALDEIGFLKNQYFGRLWSERGKVKIYSTQPSVRMAFVRMTQKKSPTPKYFLDAHAVLLLFTIKKYHKKAECLRKIKNYVLFDDDRHKFLFVVTFWLVSRYITETHIKILSTFFGLWYLLKIKSMLFVKCFLHNKYL